MVLMPVYFPFKIKKKKKIKKNKKNKKKRKKNKKIPCDCPILSDIDFYNMYRGLSDILYYKLKAHFL